MLQFFFQYKIIIFSNSFATKVTFIFYNNFLKWKMSIFPKSFESKVTFMWTLVVGRQQKNFDN